MRRSYTKEEKRKYNLFEYAYQLVEMHKSLSEAEKILISFLDDPIYKKKALFSLSSLYQKQHKFIQSYYYLSMGLDVYQDKKFLFQLIKLCIMVEDMKTARNYLNNYGLDEIDTSRIALEGELESKEGNYDKAINHFKKLRYSLQEGKANFELGLIYHLKNDNKLALEYLEKALVSGPKNKVILEILQILLEEQEQNIEKYFNLFDEKNCFDKYTKAEYERCKSYYKYINKKFTYNDSKRSYYDKQLYEYTKEESIDHICRHKRISKGINFKFFNDLSIDKLYLDCIKLIQDTSLYKGGSSDIYRVNLPYPVGYLDEYTTNFVEIVTIPKTDRILTIYPKWDYSNGEMNIRSLKDKSKCKYKQLLINKNRED